MGDAFVKLGVQVAELVDHGSLGLAADFLPLPPPVAGIAQRQLAVPQTRAVQEMAGFQRDGKMEAQAPPLDGGIDEFLKRGWAWSTCEGQQAGTGLACHRDQGSSGVPRAVPQHAIHPEGGPNIAGGCFPDVDYPTVIDTGEPGTAWVDRNPSNRPLMSGKDSTPGAGGDVPNANGSVAARGGEPGAIRCGTQDLN